MDAREQETLRWTRYNIEERQDWKGEIDRLPWIQFPSSWRVKVIPPYGDAVVRFLVKLPGGVEKSVYCDSRNTLGFYTEPPTPYWEVYPYNDDVGRCAVDDVASLLEMIWEGAVDDDESTPDHTEDKLDEVGIRDYNNRLHDLAIKILFGSASSNRHGDFDPTSDEVKRAYELADTILTIGTTYEWNEYNGIDSLRFNKAEGEV